MEKSEVTQPEELENVEKKGAIKPKWKIIIAVSVLAVLICLAVVICSGFTVINTFDGNRLVSVGTDSLDLRGADVSALDGLDRFTDLERLDIRGMDISAERFRELAEAVPECEIIWSVPVDGERYDSDISEFTLKNDCAASEIESLRFFTKLEKLDVSACTDCAAVRKLAEQMPDTEIVWCIWLGGKPYAPDTSEISLSGEVPASELERLQYFESLQRVDASGIAPCRELVSASEKLTECEFIWQAEIAGKTVKNTDSFLDLSGCKLENAAAWAQELALVAFMPDLKKIDMCGCGLTNEEMETLCAQFPNTRLVWSFTINGKIGDDYRTWTIRTDQLVFSTLVDGYSNLDERTFEPIFKYCTDLVALDLGHNKIKDISLMSNLTKIEYLILHDNRIEDISPLAGMKSLRYAELNWNQFSDLSPLCGLPELRQLIMMGGNFDIDQLRKLAQETPTLENVVLTRFSGAELNSLKAINPDCNWFGLYDVWYNLPEFHIIKEAFDCWDKVVEYNSWNDIVYTWDKRR